jgi:hypothetical protein
LSSATGCAGPARNLRPVDRFFQKDFLMNSLPANREYLFDQVPALIQETLIQKTMIQET